MTTNSFNFTRISVAESEQLTDNTRDVFLRLDIVQHEDTHRPWLFRTFCACFSNSVWPSHHFNCINIEQTPMAHAKLPARDS